MSTYSQMTLRGVTRDIMDKQARQGMVKSAKEKILGLQLFDKNAATANRYIDFASGELVVNANYYASDFIPITPGHKYRITSNGNEQLALYKKDLSYKTGYTSASAFNDQTIPSDCYYIRFTIGNAYIDSCWMCDTDDFVIVRDIVGNDKFNIEYGIIASKLQDQPYKCEATAHSISDIANLLQIANYVSDHVELTIYVDEGTYTVTTTVLNNYGAGEKGLTLPDHVNLIGLGKGATLTFDLTGGDPTKQTQLSTLNTTRNNRVENMTFIANNCRYAIHNDYGGSGDFEQVFKNCRFIHLGCSDGNWQYPTAIGEGTRSGARTTYENCDFISKWRAYFLHNNTGFTKPSEHFFKNCRFTSTATEQHIAFALNSLGSGVTDIVELSGCTFTGYFDSRGNSASIQSCDYKITGHGNGNIPELFYYTDGVPYTIETEHVQVIQNQTGATIASMTPLKCVNGSYAPMESGDSAFLFCGIANGDIASNETGYMRTGGYIRCSGISRTPGTKIGITNGQLAVVTGNEYIGIVKYYDQGSNQAYMEIV